MPGNGLGIAVTFDAALSIARVEAAVNATEQRGPRQRMVTAALLLHRHLLHFTPTSGDVHLLSLPEWAKRTWCARSLAGHKSRHRYG